jgi:hypothetical protein
MAQSKSVREDVAAARLGMVQRMQAGRHGVADGRRGLPPLPPADGERAGAERLAAPWMPYIGQVEATARRTSKQLQIWLHTDRGNAALIAKLHVLAEVVVYHHDIRGSLSPGHRGRFARALTAWRVRVADGKKRALAAVDLANQTIDWYWLQLLRNHRELDPERGGRTRPPAVPRDLSQWRPAEVTLDPIWDKPDALLLQFAAAEDAAAEDEVTARADRVLTRAIEILTEHLSSDDPPEEPS